MVEKISLIFFLIVTFLMMDIAIKQRVHKRSISQNTVEVLKTVAKTNTNDNFGELYLADFKIRDFNEAGQISLFVKIKRGWKKNDDKYFYIKDFTMLEFEHIQYSESVKCHTTIGGFAKIDTNTGDITIIGDYKRFTAVIKKEIIKTYLKGDKND